MRHEKKLTAKDKAKIIRETNKHFPGAEVTFEKDGTWNVYIKGEINFNAFSLDCYESPKEKVNR